MLPPFTSIATLLMSCWAEFYLSNHVMSLLSLADESIVHHPRRCGGAAQSLAAAVLYLPHNNAGTVCNSHRSRIWKHLLGLDEHVQMSQVALASVYRSNRTHFFRTEPDRQTQPTGAYMGTHVKQRGTWSYGDAHRLYDSPCSAECR
jgi:hypothetical protein